MRAVVVIEPETDPATPNTIAHTPVVHTLELTAPAVNPPTRRPIVWAPDVDVLNVQLNCTPPSKQTPTETVAMGLPLVASMVIQTPLPIAAAMHLPMQAPGGNATNVNFLLVTTIAHDYESQNPEVAGAQAETMMRKSKIIVNKRRRGGDMKRVLEEQEIAQKRV
jgi:hypothetical protein